MADFTRILNPGQTEEDGQIFVKVNYKDGKLSLSGVVGPTKGGNCLGSCGQIQDSLKQIVEYGEGWDATKTGRLFAIWEAWHLNDMRAGCHHQRALWDTTKRVEVTSYNLTHQAYQLRKRALEKAAQAGLTGTELVLTDTERALAELVDWFKPRYELPAEDSPLAGCFKVEKTETKTVGWVRPEEHPEGLLCKPCPECGYSYGSSWLREEVPEYVLCELQSFSGELAHEPAWV